MNCEALARLRHQPEISLQNRWVDAQPVGKATVKAVFRAKLVIHFAKRVLAAFADNRGIRTGLTGQAVAGGFAPATGRIHVRRRDYPRQHFHIQDQAKNFKDIGACLTGHAAGHEVAAPAGGIRADVVIKPGNVDAFHRDAGRPFLALRCTRALKGAFTRIAAAKDAVPGDT